jgi:hypothetical protein
MATLERDLNLIEAAVVTQDARNHADFEGVRRRCGWF